MRSKDEELLRMLRMDHAFDRGCGWSVVVSAIIERTNTGNLLIVGSQMAV